MERCAVLQPQARASAASKRERIARSQSRRTLMMLRRVPLNRPSGTLSLSGGEGRAEGAWPFRPILSPNWGEGWNVRVRFMARRLVFIGGLGLGVGVDWLGAA